MSVMIGFNNDPLVADWFGNIDFKIIESEAYYPNEPNNRWKQYVFMVKFLDGPSVNLQPIDHDLFTQSIKPLGQYGYAEIIRVNQDLFPNKSPDLRVDGGIDSIQKEIKPVCTYYDDNTGDSHGVLEGPLVATLTFNYTIVDVDGENITTVKESTEAKISSGNSTLISKFKIFCEADSSGYPKDGVSAYGTYIGQDIHSLGVLEGDKIYPDKNNRDKYYQLVVGNTAETRNIVEELKLIDNTKPIIGGNTMFNLEWDKTGERKYETGVDRGVLYKNTEVGAYGDGVAWNGLTAVNERPSGAEPTAIWADNIKYLNMISAEEFAATIEAYMSPPEFDECDGTYEPAPGITIGQQNRKSFGFSYRTRVGNDQDGQDYGYTIHLIYGCRAATSERNYSTINENPDAMTLSWEVSTTPVAVKGYKPTSHLKINSLTTDPEKLAQLEEIIYGKAATTGDSAAPAVPARLPLPDEVIELVGTAAAG